MKAGVEPGEDRDLSRLKAVGSTGSPLSPEGFRWIYEHVGSDTWLFSTSGGTDLCTAFVGGCPLLPVYEGELQARALGAAVESWSPEGEPLIGEVGELVVTEPMPSMPLFFWGDPDGERYRESYFDMFPGVWRHGDWIEITERGTAIITGRSDSTINRGGIRMGTAEIYRAVLALDDVTDALVVDIPRDGEENFMPLFVVLRDGADLSEDLVKAIRARIREDCSPRHVPNEIVQVSEVPRTLSGKVLELPVKRILQGTDAGEGREPRLARQPGGARLLRGLRGRALTAAGGGAARQPAVGRQPRAREDQQQADDGAEARALVEDGDPERERDDRVDVGDHERLAGADLGDQAAEDHERGGRADEAEDDDGDQASVLGVSVGRPAAVSGVRSTAAIARLTPIVARGSRSASLARSVIGPIA